MLCRKKRNLKKKTKRKADSEGTSTSCRGMGERDYSLLKQFKNTTYNGIEKKKKKSREEVRRGARENRARQRSRAGL